MSITHQDITDRINAMSDERDRLWFRHEKELESLVELCAGLGHRFGEPMWLTSWHIGKGSRNGWNRACEVCGHDEWVSGEETRAAIATAEPPLVEAPPTLTSEQAQRLVQEWAKYFPDTGPNKRIEGPLLSSAADSPRAD